MSSNPIEVKAVVNWVTSGKAQITGRVQINSRVSSYGLKHRAEDDIGFYISNESLIDGMIALGFRAKKCAPSSPNCYFNINIPKEKY
jgi:hypothetical protein